MSTDATDPIHTHADVWNGEERVGSIDVTHGPDAEPLGIAAVALKGITHIGVAGVRFTVDECEEWFA